MIQSNLKDFAAIILTHGRPDKVITYKTLREHGYTGKIFLLIDDLDPAIDKYKAKFGPEVIVFDKMKVKSEIDCGNNFNEHRAILFARNAAFSAAEQAGVEYFIQLDDDYTGFEYRFNDTLDYVPYKKLTNLDEVLGSMLDFYKNSNITALCMAQGGDFIGGSQSTMAEKVKIKRKGMNSFICSTKRPFKFFGLINEDVNTYTKLGSLGHLFFSTNQVLLTQVRTQSSSGGMTELYLDSGTYIKSFYSVMYQPSSVKISSMNTSNSRIHHTIKWKNTVPMILREEIKHGPT